MYCIWFKIKQTGNHLDVHKQEDVVFVNLVYLSVTPQAELRCLHFFFFL